MHNCLLCECPRSIPKAKPVGFKEWAIHAGVANHLVEKVMVEEAEKTPALNGVVAEVGGDPQLSPLRRQGKGRA